MVAPTFFERHIRRLLDRLDGWSAVQAITIPFTGVIFLKRQWMLGKRFGFVTPGEMLATYFKSDTIRLLVVLVALIFSIPYLGLQLRASGFLFNVLTDGLLDVEVGMWLLSIVVIIYVASGGLRAVAYVDTMQAILLALGIIAIGIIAVNFVGGWDKLNEGIAALANFDTKRTPDGYSHYVAIPGVIQFVSNGPSATGGVAPASRSQRTASAGSPSSPRRAESAPNASRFRSSPRPGTPARAAASRWRPRPQATSSSGPRRAASSRAGRCRRKNGEGRSAAPPSPCRGCSGGAEGPLTAPRASAGARRGGGGGRSPIHPPRGRAAAPSRPPR